MLIYGKQPVKYAIEHHSSKISTLYISKDIDQKEYSALMRYDFELKRIPANAAVQMSRSGNHQGYLADIDELEQSDLKSVAQCEFVLVLCMLTDMGNIGALIRTAYALGVGAVVITGIRSLKQEAVVRSSAGALLDMPFYVADNLYDVMTELKNASHKLYGADMSGCDIEKIEFSGKRTLLLGSEDSGIPSRALRRLDKILKIEMTHKFNSLNVSAAGAILMQRLR